MLIVVKIFLYRYHLKWSTYKLHLILQFVCRVCFFTVTQKTWCVWNTNTIFTQVLLQSLSKSNYWSIAHYSIYSDSIEVYFWFYPQPVWYIFKISSHSVSSSIFFKTTIQKELFWLSGLGYTLGYTLFSHHFFSIAFTF